MEKLLLFPGKTDNGIFTYLIDVERSHLVKTAAEYHPEIAAYINAAKTIQGKTQILITALGAGEYWGPNVNGDYFPENALAYPGPEYGFKTFETNAHVFKHHINKDPSASYGNVALSVYNPKYHRVELIVVIDNVKAPDIAQRINSGDYPDWSMGCRVPFDVCSICGNKARTRAEYCEHLKYYMGKIEPGSGKLAYAINLTPRFFDISLVLIGADRIAKTLKKVASTNTYPVVGSALLAEKMAEDKTGSIEKEIPGGEANPPASIDAIKDLVGAIPEVKAEEEPLPTEVLNSLGENPIPKVMSTLAMLGILPKPQEFQRIILVSVGKKSIADQLDEQNIAFDPMDVEDANASHVKLLGLSHDNFDPNIMKILSPFVAERSYAAPHLAKRLVIMIKKGSSNKQLPKLVSFSKLAETEERKPFGIIPVMMLIAGLYSAFGKKAPQEAVGTLDKLIAQHPGLAAALAASAPIIFNTVAGSQVRGQFDAAGTPANPDMNNMFERIEEQKQKPYLKVAGVTIGPASKRLFLGIPAAYMASGVLQKQRMANPYDEEGRIKSFIRRNPDVIAGALALDAYLALRGKGTTKLFQGASSLAKGYWQKAKDSLGKTGSDKLASAEDFLSSAVVWPSVISGANLPGRIVGGLFDQAVLEASKNILSKKRKNNTI
jgi:hypothetical protein